MSTISVNSVTQFTDREISTMTSRGVSQDEMQSFQEIMKKAQEEGGYEKPKEFLQSLSKEDMKLIQKIHCLADPIEIETLSFEGAHNLLLTHSAAKDVDDNRVVEIGAGKTLPFPPANAPDNVKKAWDEAVKGMSLRERMMAEAMFWSIELAENVKTDSTGRITGFYSPNDPEYKNIYSQPGFTYQGLINKYVEYLDIAKSQMSSQSYKEKMEFVDTLLDKFSKYNVV